MVYNKRIFGFILCLFFLHASGQDSWFFSFTPGASLVLPAPLEIRQDGYEKISLQAEYRSFPLKLPLYYSLRAGFSRGKATWDLELNHLKIYLDNTTREVDRFSVSHGYNQVFVNRQFPRKKLAQKVGLGVVVAHPESTVRQKKLDEGGGIFNTGYYLAGPAAQYALSVEIPVKGILRLLLEAKVSFGYASVPVAEGRAEVPVCAGAVLIGPELKFKKKQSEKKRQ